MTQQRQSHNGPIGIDAQLRRALDHAPDARLEPPAAVDEAILHAARLAASTSRHQAPSTQPAEPQGLGARLRAWWQRPTAVPALAVLVLATVVVSMWIRQPIPTALEKSSPETPVGKQETGAAAEAAVAEAPPSPNPVERVLDVAPSPTPAPLASPPAQASKRARNEVIESAGKAQIEARQAAPAMTAATATSANTAPGEARPSVREGMADTASQELREQATSPASTSPSAAPAAPAAKAAPAVAAPRALALNAQGAGSASQASDAARLVSIIEATPTDRLVQILANSMRWSWRQDRSQQNTAMDADTKQWLARLSRITAGRWAKLALKTDAANATRPMELWQVHELRATIIVGDKSVDWIDRDGSTWRATLSADEVSGLRR